MLLIYNLSVKLWSAFKTTKVSCSFIPAIPAGLKVLLSAGRCGLTQREVKGNLLRYILRSNGILCAMHSRSGMREIIFQPILVLSLAALLPPRQVWLCWKPLSGPHAVRGSRNLEKSEQQVCTTVEMCKQLLRPHHPFMNCCSIFKRSEYLVLPLFTHFFSFVIIICIFL